MTPGVVRVADGGSLLRARLRMIEETVFFGDHTPYLGLRDFSIEVAGGLPDLVGHRVPVVFLARGNWQALRGEVIVSDVRREPHAPVNEPLRWVWSSMLVAAGPWTVTIGRVAARA